MFEKLYSMFELGNLPNSSIIISEDSEKSYENILLLISKITGKYSKISPNNNSDVIVIDNSEDLSIINVEQIRNVIDVFSKKSSITPYKFCVIKNAELMNINASNSCLKLLEDTPENSYIFLITSNKDKLINTIKSRCFIFEDNLKENIEFDNKENIDYLNKLCEFLNPEYRFDQKIIIIEKLISEKSNLNWQGITKNIEYILINLNKDMINRRTEGFSREFTEISNIYRKKFAMNSEFLELQDYILKNLYNINKFNLDLRQILIMISAKIEIIFKS